MNKKKFRQIKFGIIIIVLFLVVFRITFPYIALRYVTNEINENTEFHTEISDLSLELLQGKASIVNMRLWKKKFETEPFLTIDKVSFSIQWSALLKGKLFGKISIQRPIINIIDISESKKRNQQFQISETSIKIFKSLIPLDVNQTTVNKGEIYFKNYQTKTSFNLYIKDINISLENMQNINREKGLAATVSLTAKAMDDANLSINGKFDPSIKTPTFYIKASLKELSLPKINSFLKEYTDIKTKSGSFSLFIEAAAAHGRIKGYAKPFIKDLQIEKDKNANVGQKIHEGAISLAYKLLKNTEQRSTATQINITGKVDDPNVSVFSIIEYLLHHAFIQALLPTVDNKLSMQDVIYKKTDK